MTPWRCELGGRPIRADTGYVDIVDRPLTGLPGGYPQAPTPDETPSVRDGIVVLTLEEIQASVPLERIAFRVVHGQCDPGRCDPQYCIDVGRARPLAEWVGWILHVGGERWMGRRDLLAMLHLWFQNRGEEPPAS